MARWVIETNLGYIEGTIGFEDSNEIKPSFTGDPQKATYRDLIDAKEWAGEIISRTLCGILYVKLVALDD